MFVMFLLSTTIGAATFIVAAGWYCCEVLCGHIETEYKVSDQAPADHLLFIS